MVFFQILDTVKLAIALFIRLGVIFASDSIKTAKDFCRETTLYEGPAYNAGEIEQKIRLLRTAKTGGVTEGLLIPCLSLATDLGIISMKKVYDY